jgi:hypothetical protein
MFKEMLATMNRRYMREIKVEKLFPVLKRRMDEVTSVCLFNASGLIV